MINWQSIASLFGYEKRFLAQVEASDFGFGANGRHYGCCFSADRY